MASTTTTTTTTSLIHATPPSTFESIPLQHLSDQEIFAQPPRPSSSEPVLIQDEGQETTEEDLIVARQYPPTPALVLISLSAVTCLLLTELDSQILVTAIPAITDSFNTVSDIGWYASGYRLAVCSFQFTFGKLYRTFPLKTVFLSSLIVFEIGSAVCGAAPTSPVFIAGRVLAGVGASGVLAGCFQVVTTCYPLRYRPAMAGVASAFEGVATVTAPFLGGVITDGAGWRWCFYMNLPLGAVTFLLIFFGLKSSPSTRPANASLPWKEKLAQLDLLGTAVFLPGICCLFLALEFGALKYGWRDWRVGLCFAVSSVLVGLFAWMQVKRGDKATLPPRILRQRSVLAGGCFNLCNNAALSVVTFYLPTYFQIVRQTSPSRSGLLLMPFSASFILALLLAGPLISILGFYVPFMLTSSILTPIASGLLTTLKTSGPLHTLFLYETLFGFGGGIGFQGPQAAVQTTLKDEDVSLGIGVIVFAQNFGPALALSAAQSLFSSRLVGVLKGVLPGVDGKQLSEMGLGAIKAAVSEAELGDVLLGYDVAITQAFYLSVGLTCATMLGSLAMEWRSVKEKKS